MAGKKTELDLQTDGLILMIFFTMWWVYSSEIYFNDSDYHVVGIVFGIAILYLIYSYIKLKIYKKSISVPPINDGRKKAKGYFTVVALEGAAIFVAVLILANTGYGDFIPSGIALIVGIHFLPFAKIFTRKIDYYIGLWTIIVAVVGLLLINSSQFDIKIVNAFVCLGCAISTTTYGFKMVKDGKLILRKYRN
ncbi:hypothetical protein [Prolixibacter sp. NT017]|uniref:hypothetical protein n=1 Tax=Prolixibacter sp. NT017 TaxID=2652390 RepID=UPI001271EDF7|nr:hypothetical protein [Prolixibacter sp. NT017]GET26002.1 hypothetical protein NT017_23310 [Prolixibacter sp. NT017]